MKGLLKAPFVQDVTRWRVSVPAASSKLAAFIGGMGVVALCGPAFCAQATIEDWQCTPSVLYSVQVAAEVDPAKAGEIRSKVIADGFSPVEIKAETPYYKVQVGVLGSYPEAHWLKDTLKAKGYEGFVQNAPNAGAVMPTALDVSSLLTPFGADTPVSQLPSDTTDTYVEGVDDPALLKQDLPGMKGRLKAGVDAAGVSDRKKGYNLYYYALACEQTTGQVQLAVPMLLSVASGKVVAPAAYRKWAALQAADIVHYTLKDYVRAYRMYSVLLSLPSWTPAEEAELRAELAGTLLEMMDSGRKGSTESVRNRVALLYRATPERFPRQRGVMELIFSETFFWDKDIDRALEYSRAMQAKYAACPAVLAQAIWNECVALHRNGQPEVAVVGLQALQNFDIPPQNALRMRLRGFDMKARAANYLKRINKETGQSTSIWLETDGAAPVAVGAFDVPGMGIQRQN